MDPFQLPAALFESGSDFAVWYSIDTFFNVITLINSVVMIIAFVKSTCLHIYFRTVCINIFALSILRAVLRIVTFIFTISKTSQTILQYCVYLLWFINITIDFAQVVVIVERLWSSMYVRVYESLRNPAVMFVLIILPFALSSILQLLLSVGLSLGLYIWLVVVVNMALWIWFYGFWKYHHWKNSKLRRSWNVNVRYQQKENRNLSVTMKWFGSYCSIHSLLLLIVLMWNRFDPKVQIYDTKGSLFLIGDVAFNMLLTLLTTFYPIPFVVTSEPIKFFYFKFLCCQSSARPNKVHPMPMQVINGFNKSDYHFQQLKKQWNEH